MSSSAVRVETWLKNAAVRAEALTDVKIWGLALVTGVATGYGVLAFSIAIEWVTEWAYGAPTAMLVDGARELSRWRTFLVPVLGALVVAAALAFSRRAGWVTDIRMQGVAEVIEARAKPPGAISFRSGLMNTGMAAVALGTGSSAGREGPAVLLGGAISVYLAKTFKLSAKDSRTLLGCAAAAAVSAAFNAPIAGVLFALEVVLSNYALSIFSPIALSSIAATLISRAHLGDLHRFVIPSYGGADSLDLLLGGASGILAGLVALAFLTCAAWGRSTARGFLTRVPMPPSLMPLFAGLGMGCIGIMQPELLGYGYQATSAALAGNYSLSLLMILLVGKIIASVLCLSCRFGTGVFSGGIYLGAMSGAALGVILEAFFGTAIASPTFFAVVGMGAVSGAIIGAPISTTLIIFELTGDYTMTAALMIAVGIATVITQVFFGTSWFHYQLNQRGYDLSEGPQGVILETIRVRDVMRPITADAAPLEEGTERLHAGQTLGEALAAMAKLGLDAMPVTAGRGENKLLGTITQIRALRAYNNALVDSHIEHHR